MAIIGNLIRDLEKINCNQYEGIVAIARECESNDGVTRVHCLLDGDSEIIISLLAEASNAYAKRLDITHDDFINELDAEMRIRRIVKGVHLRGDEE